MLQNIRISSNRQKKMCLWKIFDVRGSKKSKNNTKFYYRYQNSLYFLFKTKMKSPNVLFELTFYLPLPVSLLISLSETPYLRRIPWLTFSCSGIPSILFSDEDKLISPSSS